MWYRVLFCYNVRGSVLVCHLHIGSQGCDSVPHNVHRPIPLGRLVATPRVEGGGFDLSTTGIEQPEKGEFRMNLR